MKEKFFNGLNTLLMANLFLVLASFFWFAIALMGRLFNISLGLDIWYLLWEPVFTPAIGLLMGGAIISGIASWISKTFNLDRK
ncbi:MAG: hypothetical protein F6K09_29735 [Merismopedia sp. SIO2A8]|nr:hypothetical protein [Merismopedia sp. SIO2A8]